LNDIQLKGKDVMSTPNDPRYPADPLPNGTDRIAEESDNLETPHFAGTGKLRRGVVAPDWTRIAEGTRFAGDVAIQQLREGRALEPDLAPKVSRRRRPLRLGMFARLVAAIVIAAGATFLVLHIIPSWRVSRDQAAAEPTLQSAAPSQTTGVDLAAFDPSRSVPASVPKPAEVSTTRLPKPVLRAADGPTRTVVGEAVPLGLNVDGSTDGVVATVTGLFAGSKLSVGSPVGPTDWQLPARDLARVLVRPPAGFSGTMEIVVDLQIGGDQIVDRRWRRLEWTAAGPARAAAAPTAPSAPTPAAPVAPTVAGTLGQEEIAILIRRGEQLLETGDLSSARLLLRRAAEARDARAAFALAGTYDPLVLNKLRVYGFAPDATAARQWYRRAVELGSPEASARLDMLSSTGSR
jgi:hypothetical protein